MMKHYLLFAVIDLIVLLVYPIAYMSYYIQKLAGAKPGHKNDLERVF
jgi:hypothetical protein